MAKFPTTEARQELGVTPSTAVRFRGDTRTGEGLVGAAVGQAIMSLGSRWYIMEADAQLDEAKTQVEQEHIRLMLELPGLEPSEHAKAYEESIKTRQGFIPKNRMAASAYSRLLEGSSPRWGLDVNNATKAKLKDNVRAAGFVIQQKVIRSGVFNEYFTHLAKGKMQGVYDAEDVVKYRQATIDSRELYLKRLEAEAKRQKEIDFATHDPPTYWKLLRRVTANPKGIDEPELAAAVGPNSITTDDYKELNRIRESADSPLKTPRAQLYFSSLDTLYDKREIDAEERMKWDVANEKLMQFFTDNPKTTAKLTAEFYDDLISDEVEGIFEKAFNFWIQSPFGTLGRKVLGIEKEGEEKESPFPEYPDAFLENGIWKVIKDGKKYRIE